MIWVSGMPEPNYKAHTKTNIEAAKALLGQAINALKADLEDLGPSLLAPATKASSSADSSRVFLVHGHDEAVRETVARFLEKLGLKVIILHEQANSGRTIIEKI
ncbi:MAG: nucleotide-binding protein, partial [Halopseudomonas aestusnigri]|nr:nucleotide-binding protein [Halopseudomonas aestusnigri]